MKRKRRFNPERFASAICCTIIAAALVWMVVGAHQDETIRAYLDIRTYLDVTRYKPI